MKLTPWYPAHVKPVRVGVYERKYPKSEGKNYCLWYNGAWKFPALNVIYASQEVAYSAHQSLPWRGIAKEPK